jgi:MoxR-like ATPase
MDENIEPQNHQDYQPKSDLLSSIDNSALEENTNDLHFQNRLDVSELQQNVLRIKQEVGKVIVGQKDMVDMLIAALLAKGHALIEGVPGVAKTITAKLLAKSLSVGFSRIQFTPDLMPSDILGTSIFNLKNSEFEFKKGPIFSNMILIDEINRAPAKTQAALFEVMEEQQITIDGHKYELESPFTVLATQNPIEQEGTYPLPEAQLDRFMFNIWVDYPSFEEEKAIVSQTTSTNNATLDPILDKIKIEELQALVRKVPVPETVLDYAVKVVGSTRPDSELAPEFIKKYLSWGAGPRASQYLILGGKARALSQGRFNVTIEDINALAVPVLRHRIVNNYAAEAEGFNTVKLIEMILESLN